MAILSEYWTIDVLAVLIGLLTLFYFYAKRVYSYWERKGFKTLPDTSLLFGHFKGPLSQKEFTGDFIKRLYDSTNETFIGMYSILRPILLVRDPDIIRSILIKDFSNFAERHVHCNEDYDPLSGHMFSLPAQKWKNIRGKLTPAFSSGKLKAMFSTVLNCGSSLQSHLEKFADNGDLLDVRDVASRYTINVIASVGFGIDADAITDPNSKFIECGHAIFRSTIFNAIRFFLFFFAPKLMTLFRMKLVDSDVEKFIMSVVKENLEYREKNNVVRKDYFQLLIQLRNTGSVQLDDQWNTVINADESQKTLTVNEIAAQSFVFFAAGFNTPAVTTTFCMYELANQPKIQDKVYEEITRILAKHDGKLTYESLAEMKYLESCLDETLRKYPSLPILNRTCMKDYPIPGTNKVIEKGVEVFIPVYGLQRDEKYYEEPDKFNPDRFNEENSAGKNLLNRPYMPFGEGPRNCVAMRLGKIQTEVGLVMMLQKFRFELDDKLRNREMKLDPKSAFVIAPLQKIRLRVFKR